MNRLGCLFSRNLWIVQIALALISGCREGSTSHSNATPQNASTPSSPEEESFALVFETFCRGMETGARRVSSGFVTDEASGRSRLSVHNKVSEKLRPPTAAGEPYRATITVVSRATYSLTRDIDEQQAEEEKKREQTNATGPDSGFPADPSVSVLDPDLISAPSDSTRPVPTKSSTEPVSRREELSTRNYELVYENNRWRLTEETKKQLDPETEKAVISAFDRALGTQP
ncbi:MAG: hypothetical protein L0Z07_06770 [Planctomycetes bacterium]|nr:hypothetical protein [Planctomycetota bacterium]